MKRRRKAISSIAPRILKAAFLLGSLINANLAAKAQTTQKSFQIYCNSNKDSTGECTRIDNGEQYLCILIPGQTTSCLDAQKRKFDCVYIGDFQFNCKQHKLEGIEQVIKSSEFRDSFQNRIAPDIQDSFTPTNKPAF